MNLEAKKMRSIISEKSKKFQKLFLYENRVGKHYTLYFTPIVVCQKGIYFAASSQAEPGRSPRPRRSLFFCLIARADGAQLFVGGSESSASTRKSRSGLSLCFGFFPRWTENLVQKIPAAVHRRKADKLAARAIY